MLTYVSIGWICQHEHRRRRPFNPAHNRKARILIFSSEICIAAPSSTIWPILADVECWPQWASSFEVIEMLSDKPLDIGSEVAIKQPKLPQTKWKICAWDEGQSFAWTSRRPGVIIVANHEIIRFGENCLFRQTMTISGLLAPIVGWLSSALIREYLEIEAQGLAQYAEAASKAS